MRFVRYFIVAILVGGVLFVGFDFVVACFKQQKVHTATLLEKYYVPEETTVHSSVDSKGQISTSTYYQSSRVDLVFKLDDATIEKCSAGLEETAGIGVGQKINVCEAKGFIIDFGYCYNSDNN